MTAEPWDGWVEDGIAFDPNATREDLASAVERCSAEMREAASALPARVLERVGTIGKWSGQECLAHCIVWADYCRDVLRRSLDGTFRSEDFAYGDEDEFNERTAAERARETTAHLLEALDASAAEIVSLLRALPDAEWRSRQRYQIVVQGTIADHFPEHRTQLAALAEVAL